MVSYLVHYDTILKNETDIVTKCGKLCYKMGQTFIRQCDNFIRQCDSYYKMRRFYYKMPQLLQRATFVTKYIGTCGFDSTSLPQVVKDLKYPEKII